MTPSVGPYKLYAPSGEFRIGPIPSHWRVAPLKGHCRIVNGSTPKSGVDAYWDGAISWVTPADLSKLDDPFIENGARSISEAGYQSCGTQLVPPGSVVVSSRAPIGTVAISRQRICTNQGCKSLVPGPGIHTKFLYYALAISSEPLNVLGRGTTFLELSSEALGRFPIALPENPEQVQIAKFLDHETAKIDTLIEKQQQLIALLEEKRQAVISHAVTKGLNPDAPMRDSGVEWLGEVPAHWARSPLGYINEITVGIVVTPAKFYVKTGIPCLRSLNVRPGHLLSNNLVHISENSNDLHGKSKIRTGDIVIVRTGQPGTAAVVSKEFDGCNCIDLIIVRRSKKVLPDYLAYQLNSELATLQVSLGSGGAIQQHFNVGVAKKLQVLVPPVEEQQGITSHLQKRVHTIDSLISKAEDSASLLNERRTALISAAVTGKIDVRNWKAPDPKLEGVTE